MRGPNLRKLNTNHHLPRHPIITPASSTTQHFTNQIQRLPPLTYYTPPHTQSTQPSISKSLNTDQTHTHIHFTRLFILQ
ncbi:hypothetical protein Hanom_Chr17g01546401 [Helianthus anomalus]